MANICVAEPGAETPILRPFKSATVLISPASAERRMFTEVIRKLDLKKKSALDIDRLAALHTPPATEGILSFDIEENRGAEELGTAPARTARGHRRRR